MEEFRLERVYTINIIGKQHDRLYVFTPRNIANSDTIYSIVEKLKNNINES